MDPIGFSLGLHEALQRISASEVPWESWYLDDGTIIGSLTGIADYLSALSLALPKVGLQLNLKKCQL